MELDQDLIELRKKIEEKKEVKTRTEGQVSEMLNRLQTEHAYSSLEIAKEALVNMQSEHLAVRAQLSQGIASLKQKYPQWC